MFGILYFLLYHDFIGQKPFSVCTLQDIYIFILSNELLCIQFVNEG